MLGNTAGKNIAQAPYPSDRSSAQPTGFTLCSCLWAAIAHLVPHRSDCPVYCKCPFREGLYQMILAAY